ncbi:hypothetical protein EV644_10452 [Kribbella orskensis]|uniref:Uncharacterized protein n=1 Tax=Kribbella orskensis TaxID=2512216 RepID=A0ABY2BML9_9ACTN|nr:MULTISPECIES: hypothetical protein [Kribbella]TCN41670.1 hypothetical protein EV642_10352 [Kribbella sp. VKM Ac-2500]TCO25548.1 hypothetical protein EV644_10452 [Kribbella orskensis]
MLISAYTYEQRTTGQRTGRQQLDVTATNISTATVDPAQAKVTCDGDLNMTTDAALTVRMIGCPDRTFG